MRAYPDSSIAQLRFGYIVELNQYSFPPLFLHMRDLALESILHMPIWPNEKGKEQGDGINIVYWHVVVSEYKNRWLFKDSQ